jgi:hypothetical protein
MSHQVLTQLFLSGDKNPLLRQLQPTDKYTRPLNYTKALIYALFVFLKKSRYESKMHKSKMRCSYKKNLNNER